MIAFAVSALRMGSLEAASIDEGPIYVLSSMLSPVVVLVLCRWVLSNSPAVNLMTVSFKDRLRQEWDALRTRTIFSSRKLFREIERYAKSGKTRYRAVSPYALHKLLEMEPRTLRDLSKTKGFDIYPVLESFPLLTFSDRVAVGVYFLEFCPSDVTVEELAKSIPDESWEGLLNCFYPLIPSKVPFFSPRSHPNVEGPAFLSMAVRAGEAAEKLTAVGDLEPRLKALLVSNYFRWCTEPRFAKKIYRSFMNFSAQEREIFVTLLGDRISSEGFNKGAFEELVREVRALV